MNYGYGYQNQESEAGVIIPGDIRRGDIWYADLDYGRVGSEQGGRRPVLILQNDVGNQYSPTTIVATISDGKKRPNFPTHILIGSGGRANLSKESVILLEQLKTIDKCRLLYKIGEVEDYILMAVDNAIHISLGLL